MEKNNQPLIITAIIGGIVLIIALALIFTRNNDSEPETNNQTNTTETESENNGSENGVNEGGENGNNGQQPDPTPTPSPTPDPQPTPTPTPDPEPQPGGLPDNWNSLTDRQKADLNPFNCDHETQWVSAEDGSCITLTQIIISPNATKVEPGFKIIIPIIDIEAPVITDIDPYKSKDVNETEAQWEARIQKHLEGGVIHYPKTPYPGESGTNENSNVVILGHSASTTGAPGDYKRIFSNLRTLKLDDFILVNYNEIQYIYKVKSVKMVKPDQIEDVLESGKLNNSLTLITHHPADSSSNRLVVTAVQINPNPTTTLP